MAVTRRFPNLNATHSPGQRCHKNYVLGFFLISSFFFFNSTKKYIHIYYFFIVEYIWQKTILVNIWYSTINLENQGTTYYTPLLIILRLSDESNTFSKRRRMYSMTHMLIEFYYEVLFSSWIIWYILCLYINICMCPTNLLECNSIEIQSGLN